MTYRHEDYTADAKRVLRDYAAIANVTIDFDAADSMLESVLPPPGHEWQDMLAAVLQDFDRVFPPSHFRPSRARIEAELRAVFNTESSHVFDDSIMRM
jgi:hypothetical protein